jgi:hypothetical protein
MQENKQEKSLIKKNILSYLAEIGVTPYECYKKTGITRGILSQKNGITEDNIAKFLAYYTDVNIEWLITGRGKMTIPAPEDQKNLISSINVVNEPETIYYNKIMLENETLKADSEALRHKIGQLKEKLYDLQDTLVKLMAEKIGNEDLIDKSNKQRGKNPKITGFRGLHDARVHMLLKQLVVDMDEK